MAGRTEWINEEKTIIHHIYEGDVTLEDYYRVIDEHYRLATELNHPVHSIMDRSGIRSSPASISSVMRYANKKLPPNQGLRIVIGGRMLTKMIVNNIGKVVAPNLTKDVYFVDSLEEAIRLIHEKTETDG